MTSACVEGGQLGGL